MTFIGGGAGLLNKRTVRQATDAGVVHDLACDAAHAVVLDADELLVGGYLAHDEQQCSCR